MTMSRRPRVPGLVPCALAWCVMLVVSVANGALRDLSYGPQLGALAGHQLSTAIGAVLLGGVIAGFVRRYPPASDRQALAIGLAWTTATVAFEFLFFHYAGGHAWAELLANYDLSRGRVWVLLLIWIALAPVILRPRQESR
jgi:hypothetical protein